MGAFTTVHCIRTTCPDGDNQFCYIPLPLQSPLGRYEDQQYRPTGEWPATFLCLRHGQLSVDSPASIHPEIEPRVQGQPVPPMWMIEAECAHENCGKLHTIYTARAPDRETVLKQIGRLNPAIPCRNHNLVWREDLLKMTEFPFEFGQK